MKFNHVGIPTVSSFDRDAQVQLTPDAPVHVLAVTQPNDKGDWPDPSVARALPAAKGDSPPDHVPAPTILY
jgi:hypothetical protein